jgi:hypothetical protein
MREENWVTLEIIREEGVGAIEMGEQEQRVGQRRYMNIVAGGSQGYRASIDPVASVVSCRV